MKISGFASVAVLALTMTSAARAQTCGDVNGDGAVTVSDGVNVLRAAAGLDATCGTSSCDLDGDGTVTVRDGVNALRAAVGLSSVCDDTITNYVDQTRLIALGTTDVPSGRLERDDPPIPTAGAAASVSAVDGSTSPTARRTVPYRLTYDVAARGARAAANDVPSLIVAVKHRDGTFVPGFFEVPLSAAASRTSIAALTFSARLSSEPLTLSFATRSSFGVSAYLDIPLSPLPPLRTGLELVDTEPTPFGFPWISPDGDHLYISDFDLGAVVSFERDPMSGELIRGAEFRDAPFLPLAFFSADGRNAYAFDNVANAVGAFGVDEDTGALSFLGSEPAPGTPNGGNLTISPDGKHLYHPVAIDPRNSNDAAIEAYERDPRTGTVHALGIRSPTITNHQIAQIVVRPDGAFVYAIPFFVSGVLTFKRDAQAGMLMRVPGSENLFQTPSLSGTVVMSSDSRFVYVSRVIAVGHISDEQAGFFVDVNVGVIDVLASDPTTGQLTLLVEYRDRQDGIEGLGLSPDMTLSADDAHLYVGSVQPLSGQLSIFDRDDDTGTLSFVGTFFDQVGITEIDGNVTAFPAKHPIASPDGADVYLFSGFGPVDSMPETRTHYRVLR
jgi:6-phosphogluconolactonase (cycloisomerase 2 family)